jgi:hypothetical protein
MSRISFSMIEAGYIPGNLNAFKKEAGKIKLYGDSPPAQPTDVTHRSLTMSKEVEPYYGEVLGKAKALTEKDYQTYSGERQAEFDPMQLQAQQSAANLAESKQLGSATTMAGLAGLAAGDIKYDQTKFANQFTAPTEYDPTKINAASITGAGIAGYYMNPYTQNVTDIQTREAQRMADIAATQRGAQAVGAGAFGGARQAIMDAEAARNLAIQKGDITAKGQQDAYQQAMAQFNAEQQANLTAKQLTEQSKQFGYGQQMTAAQQAAQYGLAAQQAEEQSKQFGANLGLQGIQQQLAAASTLGQLGQTQFGQEKDIINAQAAAGAQRQAADQALLDTKYQDFLRQEQYPYQQLSYMAEMARGTPLSNMSQSIYQAPPSTSAQLLGMGTAALGASKYFANGGLTALALHNMTK